MKTISLAALALTFCLIACKKKHDSEKIIEYWRGTWNIDSVSVDSTSEKETGYKPDGLNFQKSWDYSTTIYRNYGEFTIDKDGSGTLDLAIMDWNDTASSPAKFNFYTINYGKPYYAFIDMLILECDTTKYVKKTPACQGSLFKFFMEDDGKKNRVVRMAGSDNNCVFPPFYDVTGFREHFWFLSKK